MLAELGIEGRGGNRSRYEMMGQVKLIGLCVGRPSLARCREIKEKLELQKELASLDTSSILSTRTRPRRGELEGSPKVLVVVRVIVMKGGIRVVPRGRVLYMRS